MHITVLKSLFAIILLLSLGACSKKPQKERKSYVPVTKASVEDLERYRRFSIGKTDSDRPWIAHVNTADLDNDGYMDVVGCDAKLNEVFWIRQLADGSYEEIIIGRDLRAPVHVETADMDGDGDLDLIISSMSVVFPNNDKIGAIFILENLANGEFKNHLVIEGIDRVVDARAADFDEDGQLDLAVAQFGYDQGEVRWMRRTDDWSFESHVVLSLSGSINVCVADFDENGSQDFAVLVSQQWEEIHLFQNNGKGQFTSKVIWGSTNEDYSCSGMSMGDINKDGKMDLVFSNGDGFGPNPEPGPKPWHGVQWLENRGQGFFKFHRVGDLGGAYSPVAVDLDNDSDMDIVALSGFNDWNKPKAESIVWFKNDGYESFTKTILAYEPTHLITLDIQKMKPGSPEHSLITGGFHAYPPYNEEKMSRVSLWKLNN